MNLKHIATAGALTAALLGAGATSAFAATGTTSTNPGNASGAASTCLPAGHDDVWPVSADGRPGRDPGVSVWHDVTGWHVRVTHNAVHDRVFSGEIVTTGALVDVKAVRMEKNDYLALAPNADALRFRFNNYGGTDGFDFATRCAPFLGFGFATDGHALSTADISIGAAGRHPAHDPFVITRLH